MVPDIDLQLQVAIKALSDAIAPAVDPDDKMATEQLQLVIATLTMARERLPVERRMGRRLLAFALVPGLTFASAAAASSSQPSSWAAPQIRVVAAAGLMGAGDVASAAGEGGPTGILTSVPAAMDPVTRPLMAS